MRAAIVIASAFAAIASATAPAVHQVKRATVLSYDFETTWDALIDVFADHNWTIHTLEKNSGLITTDWLGLGDDADRYADCGGSGLASRNGVQVRFSVRVKRDGDEATSISVSTTFREEREFDNRIGWADCVSLGTIESTIHGAVDRRAASEEFHRAQRDAHVVVTEDPAWFCTSSTASPEIGGCSRAKDQCEQLRSSIASLVADLSKCKGAASAVCFHYEDVERCFSTEQGCAIEHDRKTGATACAVTK